jgi:NADPH:quinone reductase-like Zn-dependent oxidoreductase
LIGTLLNVSMKAVRIHEYGGASVLLYEDAPIPELNPDDVLIKVYASGVNPVDWKVREGLRRRDHKFPFILGWDVSGVIDKIGSEVADFKKGDEVYSRPDLTRNGSYAEYMAVRASEIALKPKTLNHIEAASVPLAALTAWQALFTAGDLQAGQKVLLLGASGGVGSFATQLAKWKKATVVAVCSTKNVDYVSSLGANKVIDYSKNKFEEADNDFDLVFDMVGGETKSHAWKVTKSGGTFVSITGAPDTNDADAQGKKGVGFLVSPNQEQLTQIANLIDSNVIKPLVNQVLPLWEARKAQDMLQYGHNLRGKIVLRVVE